MAWPPWLSPGWPDDPDFQAPGVVFGPPEPSRSRPCDGVDVARLPSLPFPQAAAKGEEGIASENSDVCPDSDHMHWLVRANVVVGVKFDPKLGADRDPFVAEARADLLRVAA